ncbi:porin [Allorhizobium sp. BGMRC 0089]|uniref:porin n=1 Tax=Allorhizobium sonneratiae TaxID=2934936 RepID=UPI002033AB33|nr:porin [Allorhizobium sonneratiae]MCM2290857.1 porin [Allorhizobium sonneratiae]
MLIKKILLSGAASLVALSGVHAADAIVAAAPEPADYVRVCDAFGTGYFYIPGTETCLKFGGQFRYTFKGNDLNDKKDASTGTTGANWADEMRARINISTKMDSELGTIGTDVQLHSKWKSGSTSDGFEARLAYITIGGFTIGRMTSFVDNNGNNSYWPSFVSTNLANGDSVITGIRYETTSGPLKFGVGIDDLQDSQLATSQSPKFNKDLGFETQLSYKQDSFSSYIWGVYDNLAKHGVVYGHAENAFGPHLIQFDAEYASGISSFEGKYNWAVSADYTYTVNDKLTVGPSVAYNKYFDSVNNGKGFWTVGGDTYYYLQKDKNTKTFVQAGLGYDTYDKALNSYLRLRRDF